MSKPLFRRPHVVLPALAIAALGLALPAMRPDDAPGIELAEARLIIEVNATDGDAGVQAFVDGEPWDRLLIGAPDGRKILDVKASRNLGDLGATELFFESNEPEFADLPLDEFLALFPEGTYSFIAIGIDGVKQVGEAEFTHAIPDGPIVHTPADGATVDAANVVIDWDPVADPPGSSIVEYEVIVEDDTTDRSLSIHLPASVTSIHLPAEFFASGQEYAFEVLAIEAGGNQTITEASFSTL